MTTDSRGIGEPTFREDASRVPTGYLLTTHDFDLRTAEHWPTHTHAEHELLWCEAGMAKVEAEGRV